MKTNVEKLPVITGDRGRKFTCFPAAILVFVVNSNHEVLLFSTKKDEWKNIAGAIEDEETILESAHRELNEEAGTDILAQPVGVVHAHTFHYDRIIRNLISIHYVMLYVGGKIKPGDDMKGAEFRWFSLAEIKRNIDNIVIPHKQLWIFERAVAMASKYKTPESSLEYFVSRSQTE